MHLSLPVIRSSLSKHHPLVTLQLPPKTSRVQTFFFYTNTKGGLVSRVSPSCNSIHYMPSLPSVPVQHLKRRFSFPSLLLCSVAP